MKKTTTIFMTLTFVATMAMAQGKPAATPAPAAATADPVIISAGDCIIKKSEFEGALKSLPPEYQQYAQGPGKKQFADDFLRMKMLAAEGMKNGLDKDADVQKQLSLMKENLVANAQLQKVDKSIAITDEDLKKIYDADKKDYEQVKASHILIAFKGSPAAQKDKPELTDDQAKAKADELRAKIAGGADFAEIAKKESDDTGSGSRGGELGSFGRGQMVPEFETAAFNAKPGDVTPVVHTQFGYHIIKVEAHDYTPFEGVKASIEKKEHQKRLQAALDAMKDKAKPTYNEAYFAAPPAPEGPKAELPATKH